MFCTKCGKQLPYDNTKFCPYCGAGIKLPKAGKASVFPRKKIMAIALVATVVIAIAFGTFLFMKYIQGAPGNSGGSAITQTDTITPISDAGSLVIIPTPTEPPLPATGVWVRVNYLGSWGGSYGKADALVSAIDSGLRQYQVESSNGTIQASFQKRDGSNHELIVEIYRNGVLLKQGTTNAPQGFVNVSVDLANTTLTNTMTSGTTAVTQKAVNSTITPKTVPTTLIAGKGAL